MTLGKGLDFSMTISGLEDGSEVIIATEGGVLRNNWPLESSAECECLGSGQLSRPRVTYDSLLRPFCGTELS